MTDPAVRSIPFLDADGNEKTLDDLGDVVLVVNVASKCGLTPQYEQLEELQRLYGDRGFSVVGFPCNQFFGQEPGSMEQILDFCSTTYGADFELLDKVVMAEEPYTTLSQSEPAGPVAWNFEKFLVGKDGTVLGRYKSNVEPDSAELSAAIEAAIAA